MAFIGWRAGSIIFALAMAILHPLAAFAVSAEEELLESLNEAAVGFESDLLGDQSGIRCPKGLTPAEIVPGQWICISDLQWDDARPRRKSLRVCFDTELPILERVCIKLRIECRGDGEDRSCNLEIIPPWPLPNQVCVFRPDSQNPGQFQLECPDYPGFKIRDREIIEPIPGFMRPYRVVDDGNMICFEDPSLEQSICFLIDQIYRTPGIRQLLPLIPGFAALVK